MSALPTITLRPNAFSPAIADEDGLVPFPIGLDRYHRMIELGLFETTDKVELLDGYLVSKMPQGDPHHYTVSTLNELMMTRVVNVARVTVQSPIVLGSSEPEPDVCLSARIESQKRKKPTAENIFLVVEVAETSLAIDRGRKLHLYATHGIPEYWVVNLVNRQVEVYTKPNPVTAEYESCVTYGEADSVPIMLLGQTLGSFPVAEIL